MSEEIFRKIYELKGIVNAANVLVNHDPQYDYPLLENISDKVDQVIGLIEKKSVGETL